ncbi:MAG: hypothetical protein ABIT71_06065 [Vicinamibacteraceae bacterium]
MEYLWFPCFVASVLAFIGFRQWLRHQQRAMVHRERLAALDKGADLPPWPDEAPSRFDFGLDSVLLLSGLIWLALGLGGMVAAFVIVSQPQIQRIPDAVPPHIALIGVPVALVGIAHLIVYRARRRTR